MDRSFWAICTDNDGNLAGIIPFRNGKDARKISVNNHFNMLVNTTDKAPALGYAILKNLAYADGLRVSTCKADGLTTPIPAPPAVKVVVPPKEAARQPLPANLPPLRRPLMPMSIRMWKMPTTRRKRLPTTPRQPTRKILPPRIPGCGQCRRRRRPCCGRSCRRLLRQPSRREIIPEQAL